MASEYKCGCGEINPQKFYKNQKRTCKACRSKINKIKYIPSKKLTAYEKFSQSYDKDEVTGCWLWNKSKNDNGYGRFNFKYKMTTAHRKSYELFRGEIPKGMFVCHKCDIPCCVNPDHLFLGTHDDNMKDMVAKGRGNGNPARGVDNNMAILTEAQAQEIIDFNHYHGSLTYLAKKFNTSPQTIFSVKTQKSWGWLKKTKN